MAVDRRTIEDQLIAIGEADRWWDQREVRELPHILNADERIRALATGWLSDGCARRAAGSRAPGSSS